MTQNTLSHLINDSLQRFEECVGTKLRDDGVHIDFVCKSCGQKWGEEEKPPTCKSFFNAQMDKRIIQSQLSVIQAIKEKCLGMIVKEHDSSIKNNVHVIRRNAHNAAFSTLSEWLQEAEDLISNQR